MSACSSIEDEVSCGGTGDLMRWRRAVGCDEAPRCFLLRPLSVRNGERRGHSRGRKIIGNSIGDGYIIIIIIIIINIIIIIIIIIITTRRGNKTFSGHSHRRGIHGGCREGAAW